MIGSGQFIPGFEEQLTGVKTGDEKTITVTFPEDYPAEHLAGKEAEFDVTVKQVKVEGETKIDDEFAKGLGLESLDKLQGTDEGPARAGNRRPHPHADEAPAARQAGRRTTISPCRRRMVEAEFEQIWNQLQQEAAKEEDPEAALKEIEAEKDDYQRIAERRVRLGLLLSEIGQANGVEVSQQEMQMLIQQAAQQYRPEDRQRFMRICPATSRWPQAQLRAPLYEDKVVDFLFDKAEVTEREVTREELEAAIEAEEDAEAEKAKPAAKKKAPAKQKAPAKKATPTPTRSLPPRRPRRRRRLPRRPTTAKKAAAKAPAKKAAAKKARPRRLLTRSRLQRRLRPRRPPPRKTPSKARTLQAGIGSPTVQ